MQYKKEGLKFCKLLKNSKTPFEKNWTNLPYDWNTISEWINEGNNFGVLCGYGGLIVIDSDNEKLKKVVDEKLPKTFRVRTGSGGTHDYYICEEVKKKIILQNGTQHLGEVQSVGTQVVGAGSTHPNGNKYEIVNDVDIVSLNFQILIDAIKPFMKEIEITEKKITEEIKSYGETDINNVKITDIVDTSKFNKAANGELNGTNPWHGSSTGMNYWINPQKNISHCFRCNEGLSVAKVIALENGLITSCSDNLSKELFISVLEIAQKKYGLVKRNTKIQEASNVLNDKLLNAKQFLSIQPIYYDRYKMWWLWNFKNYNWELTDEIDILNQIVDSLHLDVISSNKRVMLLNSLKQVGRKNKPKDLKKTWIQFKDKIIDIETDKIISASPEYFATNPIPWKIGNSEDTPTMDKIFKEWVGEEYVKTLYQIIAYCLIPDYPLHRLFCFIGEGLNGKSKFLDLVTKFVGVNNTCSTELDTLLNSRFEMTRLHKKLMCQMGETNFVEMTKTSMLKKLTGGDLISYEYKGKDLFQDYNYAKILISTNNLPATTDKTIGFYRRWLIIDFPNKFSEKKNILATIPREEYENLARKSISILKDLYKHREFSNEGTVEQRQIKFEDKSNPFDKFMKEMVEEEPNGYIFKFEFKKELDAWCKANRFRTLSDNFILKKLKLLGVDTQRITANWTKEDGERPKYNAWIGVQWKVKKEVENDKNIQRKL